MCLPRLSEGLTPACVSACPTNAITVEKVNIADWRADHSAADAPELPSSELTLSTTRIALPEDVPLETFAASDWNLRPEHPHWPLVWLTLVSQLSVGTTVTMTTAPHRLVAAVLAAAGLAGALLHLGRPAHAWKALRNLRRSWLSREVALLGLHAMLAALAVVVPGASPVAAAVGVLGVYASARLYVVPGRPAWDTPLTVVRFFATAAMLGPLLTGHLGLAVGGGVVALGATAANWLRLGRSDDLRRYGSVRLELRWFRPWTVLRWLSAVVGLSLVLTGEVAGALAILAASELIGRWLFFVTVVPLDVPGSFWRGTR
jgi:DMSO reductase anchor subunit